MRGRGVKRPEVTRTRLEYGQVYAAYDSTEAASDKAERVSVLNEVVT